MRWSDVRSAHPDRWLVVEALDAHSEADHRIFDQIEVVEVSANGPAAMKRYGELRREHPHREFCFVHTSLDELKFEERLWLGIRGLRATDLTA
jgi:RNase adaptor protein for sRNA GlmZ degradation